MDQRCVAVLFSPLETMAPRRDADMVWSSKDGESPSEGAEAIKPDNGFVKGASRLTARASTGGVRVGMALT